MVLEGFEGLKSHWQQWPMKDWQWGLEHEIEKDALLVPDRVISNRFLRFHLLFRKLFQEQTCVIHSKTLMRRPSHSTFI